VLIVINKLTKSRGINSIKNLQPKNCSWTQNFAGLRWFFSELQAVQDWNYWTL